MGNASSQLPPVIPYPYGPYLPPGHPVNDDYRYPPRPRGGNAAPSFHPHYAPRNAGAPFVNPARHLQPYATPSPPPPPPRSNRAANQIFTKDEMDTFPATQSQSQHNPSPAPNPKDDPWLNACTCPGTCTCRRGDTRLPYRMRINGQKIEGVIRVADFDGEERRAREKRKKRERQKERERRMEGLEEGVREVRRAVEEGFGRGAGAGANFERGGIGRGMMGGGMVGRGMRGGIPREELGEDYFADEDGFAEADPREQYGRTVPRRRGEDFDIPIRGRRPAGGGRFGRRGGIDERDSLHGGGDGIRGMRPNGGPTFRARGFPDEMDSWEDEQQGDPPFEMHGGRGDEPGGGGRDMMGWSESRSDDIRGGRRKLRRGGKERRMLGDGMRGGNAGWADFRRPRESDDDNDEPKPQSPRHPTGPRGGPRGPQKPNSPHPAAAQLKNPSPPAPPPPPKEPEAAPASPPAEAAPEETVPSPSPQFPSHPQQHQPLQRPFPFNSSYPQLQQSYIHQIHPNMLPPLGLGRGRGQPTAEMPLRPGFGRGNYPAPPFFADPNASIPNNAHGGYPGMAPGMGGFTGPHQQPYHQAQEQHHYPSLPTHDTTDFNSTPYNPAAAAAAAQNKPYTPANPNVPMIHYPIQQYGTGPLDPRWQRKVPGFQLQREMPHLGRSNPMQEDNGGMHGDYGYGNPREGGEERHEQGRNARVEEGRESSGRASRRGSANDANSDKGGKGERGEKGGDGRDD